MATYKMIKVLPETYDLIHNDCKSYFYTKNPTIKGLRISNGKLLHRMALVYLERENEL